MIESLYIEVSQPKEPKPLSKYHYIVYSVFSFISIVATLVDLALSEWYQYCWWTFGLVFAEPNTRFDSFENEGSIGDVKSDSCGSLKHLVNTNCPGFCSHIDGFDNGGAVMILFGTLAMLFNAICIFFHILKLYRSNFKLKIISPLSFLPSFLYILGFSIYFGVAKFSDLEETNGKRFGTKDFEMKGGLLLGFTIIGLNLLLFIYCYFTTKKTFLS
ncbi:unnamed protein product [Blepharisma stoltei]|uniref:Uncharacterized protein n=1 Tax=Blepharisma stoltei TaxID=1481888 RepID=A0AAU9JFR5_9CILI|nr:unnamed protein product [Blepharisma stoltei]